MTLPLRVIGRDVNITADPGGVSAWETASLSDPSSDFEATAGDAERKQFVDGQDDQVVIAITGFLGEGQPPAKNSIITDIDIAVGVDSVTVEDYNDPKYGVWKVKNPKYDIAGGPGKYSFEIRSNYLE